MSLSDFDNLQDTEAPTAPATPTEPTPYEQDFLPAQRKYFEQLSANPKLSASMTASLLESDTAAAQKSYMQRTAVQQAGMDLKSRQMQFETAKFTLDQAREEAARKRNMFGDLAKLQVEVLPIIANATTDYAKSKQDLGLFKAKYAGLATVNPAVANLFNAADSSLVNTPKDQVTKLDYINKGAHPKALADYETKIGRPLEANEAVPIDIYGAGVRDAIAERTQVDVKEKAIKQQQEGLDRLLKPVLDGKLTKDPLKPMAEATTFDNGATEPAIRLLVDRFGSSEDKKKFKVGIPASEQLSIGQRLAFWAQSRAVLPELKSTKPSLATGFTSPTPQ